MNIFVNNISMLIVKKRLGLQTSCLLFETFYRNNGIKSKKKTTLCHFKQDTNIQYLIRIHA